MDKGFYRVARPFGVVLLVHWSLPLGALIASGLEFTPVVWLGFIVIVLAHDAGHALFAKWLGQRVIAWELTAVGGVCRFRGNASNRQRASIAWGGIAAQLLLAATTWALVSMLGSPQEGAHAQALVHTLTELNLWLAAINLLPLPSLDGALAWKVFANFRGAWGSSERRILFGVQRWLSARQEARTRRAGQPPARARLFLPLRRSKASDTPALSELSLDDEQLPEQPSEQAQAELNALLERIAQEAGKAPRKH